MSLSTNAVCYINNFEKIMQSRGSFEFLCSLDVRDPWRIVSHYGKARNTHTTLTRDPCGDKLRLLPATSTPH